MFVGEQLDPVVEGADGAQQVMTEARTKKAGEFMGFHPVGPLAVICVSLVHAYWRLRPQVARRRLGRSEFLPASFPDPPSAGFGGFSDNRNDPPRCRGLAAGSAPPGTTAPAFPRE